MTDIAKVELDVSTLNPGNEKELANWAQSMRLLYYWIKAKLEAVSFGLNSVEKEFLSDIVTTLPNGTQQTIWDMIEGQMASGNLMLEYRVK